MTRRCTAFTYYCATTCRLLGGWKTRTEESGPDRYPPTQCPLLTVLSERLVQSAYGMSGTEIRIVRSAWLCACYAMSVTERAYSAT
eukprot:3032397-Rhodomonas_salina.2